MGFSPFVPHAHAASTYTAIASGDWNDNSVWQGGVIPPYLGPNGCTPGTIIINSGVTVTFSTGNNFCSQATLDIYGTFDVASGASWYNYGTTNLYGTLDVGSNGFAQYGSFYEYCGATINGQLYGGQATNLCSTPTVSTSLSRTAIIVGQSVTDSATLSGESGSAGGTVQYEYFASNSCTGSPTLVGSPVGVSGGSVPNSQSVTFSTPGSYGWEAAYSGDSNDNPATSACEALVVASTTTLTLSANAGVSGTTIALQGSGYDTGVNYEACPAMVVAPHACEGPGIGPFAASPTGTINEQMQVIVNSPGPYLVIVVSGSIPNVNIASQASFTALYQVSISTSLPYSTYNPIDTIYDTATLSGEYSNAGGTVTYSMYSGSSCSGSALFSSTVTVTNGVVPNSPGTQEGSLGSYSWRAVYSGDGSDSSATGACQPMTVTVPTSPTISANVSTVDNGQPVTLTLSWSGGATPIFAALYTESSSTCNTSGADTAYQQGLTSPPAIFTQKPSSATHYCGEVFDHNFVYSSTSSTVVVTVNADPTVSLTTLGPFTYSPGATASALQAAVTYAGTNTVSVEWHDSPTPSCGSSSPNTGTSGTSLVPSTTSLGTTYYCAVVSDSGVPGYSSISPAVEVTVQKPTPTIDLTPSPVEVTFGDAVSAEASLLGGNNPTGTITFMLTEAPSCSTVLGTWTTPVTSGIVTGASSPLVTPPVSGTLYWIVQYSGDSNNGPVSTTCGAPGSSVLVDPATTTLDDSPSPASVMLGTTPPMLSDAATLSGGYHPSGTILFQLLTQNDIQVCQQSAQVSGDGQYAASCTLATSGTVAGLYHWQAQFTSDNVGNIGSFDTDNPPETVTVQSASPTLTTTSSPASAALGSLPPAVSDAATLSGGYFPTGTIVFVLTGPGGATVDTQTVAVNGDGTYTAPTTSILLTASPLVGVYQWHASYSGDANNNPVNDQGGPNEAVTINPAAVVIATIPSPVTLTLGATNPTLGDTATITGGYNPTGTITFVLKSPGGQILDTEIVSVSGNAAYTTPTGYTLPTAQSVIGIYQWTATYSGDSNNAGTASTMQAKVLPGPTSTYVSCLPSTTMYGAYGAPPVCTGTVTAADAVPAGAVAFTDTTTGTQLGTCTLSVGSCTPTSFFGLDAGTHVIEAQYQPDNDNFLTSSSTTTVVVSPASSQTVISCSPTPVDVGGSTTCTATVTTAHPVAGAVILSQTGGSGAVSINTSSCTLLEGIVGGVTVGVCSITATATGPGAVTLTAAYVPDPNHSASSGTTQISVSKDSPTIGSSVSSSGTITVGTSATDTATLSGAYSPTGSVTFVAYSDSACTTSVFTSTQSLSGSVATSGSFTPTSPGTYYLTASFPGDSDNNAVSTPCGASGEVLTVNKVSPTITTSLSATTVDAGQQVTDSATLTGTYAGGAGTVAYDYFTSSTCAGPGTLVGAAVTVSAGAIPSSSSQSFATSGQYGLEAIYSGDANNKGATSACEPLTVNPQLAAAMSASVQGPVGLGQTFTVPTSGGTQPYKYAWNVGSLTQTSGCGPTDSSCAVTTSAVGSYPIVVQVTDGAGASVTVTTSLTAFTRATSAAVVCSSPVIVNVLFTCTATVTDTDVGAASTPQGMVAFASDGSTTTINSQCTLSQVSPGISSCEVTYTPNLGKEGSHGFSASYSGDPTHIPSTSSFSPTYVARSTSTAVSCSPAMTLIGSAVTCTATVTDTSGGIPATPTGGIAFSTDSLGTFPPNPCKLTPVAASTTEASCSIHYNPSLGAAGTTHIGAAYSEDVDHSAGTATPFALTVTRATSSVSASCSPNPVPTYLTAVCKVSVTGQSPTGTVTLGTSSPTGSFSQSSCTLSAGACSVSYSDKTAGAPTITAAYGGDANNLPGSATTSLTVQSPAQAVNALMTLKDSMGLDEEITHRLDAQLSASLKAINAGDYNSAVDHLNSFINEVNDRTGDGITTAQAQTLNSAAQNIVSSLSFLTTTALTCHPATVFVGAKTTCEATVVGVGKTTLLGTLAFTSSDTHGVFGKVSCGANDNGDNQAGKARQGGQNNGDNGGTAMRCSVDYSSSSAGVQTLTASYPGDANHAPSSATFKLTVTLIPTTTTLRCDPSKPDSGKSTHCEADITSADGSPPTGAVTFSSSDTQGTFGKVTCTTSSGHGGGDDNGDGKGAMLKCVVDYTPSSSSAQTLTATYPGDATHSPSSATSKLNSEGGDAPEITTNLVRSDLGMVGA